MMAYILSLVSMTVLFFVNKSNPSTTACRQDKTTEENWRKQNPKVYGPAARAVGTLEVMGDNPLTSHVLDTALGKPAAGIPTTLFKLQDDGSWDKITSKVTDRDGRVARLLKDHEFTVGIYKFHFDTKTYYSTQGTKTFYPYVEIVFEIEEPSQHYHVPILLSPFGYSTYRGS